MGHRDGVICCGTTCMDLFLVGTKPLSTPEGCSLVDNFEMYPGGSTSNTGRMIKFLKVNVEILTLIGEDAHGNHLIEMWRSLNIGTSFVRRVSSSHTALSVLPVYADGKRGLYFCSGTNKIMDKNNLITTQPLLMEQYQIFHYGYPHLTPLLQNQNLAELFKQARNSGCITSIDVNGADSNMDVIAASLPLVDIFHSNVEEALLLNGKLSTVTSRILADVHTTNGETPLHIDDIVTIEEVAELARSFLNQGVAIVTITLGGNGVYTAITAVSQCLTDFRKTLLDTALSYPAATGVAPSDIESLLEKEFSLGRVMWLPAFCMTSTKKNTTGAGDGFVAGFLCGLCKFAECYLTLKDIINLAQHTAIARITNAAEVDLSLPIQTPRNLSVANHLQSTVNFK